MDNAASRRNVEDIHELSPLQQGMLFHGLRDAGEGAYCEQVSFHLEGAIDAGALQRAWQQVVDRHPALRTSFQWEGLEKPLAVVHRRVAVPFAVEDWSGLSAPQQAARLAALEREERARGFGFSAAPLMRVVLARTGPDRHWCVWTHSHLLLDGWCLPLIFGEVVASYEAQRSGRAAELPARLPYRDFIAWLRTRDREQARVFWTSELAGFDEPTPLPVRSPVEATEPAGEWLLQFTPEETAALQAGAREAHVTLNTLCQAAWALVLARSTGRREVVFGVTVAGRPAELAGADAMIGLFINTLPARATVPPAGAAAEWLQALQARIAAARAWEHTPLTDVHGWSAVPRERALFETLFVFENYPGSGAEADSGPWRVVESRTQERTNYPLTLAVAPGATLAVRWLYDGVRADRCAAEELAGRFRAAVLALAAGRRLEDIDVLTDGERRRLLEEWNPPVPSAGGCWLGDFAACVARVPEAPAAIFCDSQLTYRELAARADRLAAVLRSRGVGAEVVVGLCIERSLELPVAVLAVLKAGGAYVPLDAAYPQDRLEFMVRDSRAALVLASCQVAARFGAGDAPVLVMEDAEAAAAAAVAEPAALPAPAHLAYVIYTSGSTGRPKGVMIEHRGWANLVRFQHSACRLGAGDRVLQFSSASFDASVWEMSLALSCGAALALAPREELLPGDPLARTLREQAVTAVLLPPSALAHLPPGDFPRLRLLIAGGEASWAELIARWAPGRVFVNAYGPTENSVVATWTELRAGDVNVPIGAPVTGARAYVLDEAGRLLPPGAAGELCVAGASLARGYLGRPELTAERFVPDPFAREPGARLYRTGDLVRWGADGRLEFCGRIDDQVKLRGYRVELGEIEAVLASHPGVREVAVAVRGEAQLAAWVVVREGADVSVAELRARAREKLPEHMVPGAWTFLAALPLTPNGKVNKKALPAPEPGADEPIPVVVAGGSPLVELVAGVFAEVLGLSRVGADGNFFELGGHSLLATKLISRLRERVAPGLPLRAVFDAPTPAALAELAAAQRAGRADTPPALTARTGGGPAPASFGQQRFWLLERLTPGNAANHLQLVVRLRGPLVSGRLRVALAGLMARHEPLRTGLAEEAGAVVQAGLAGAALPFVESDGRDWKSALAADAAAAFDFARRPLWRARLLRLGVEEHVLAFTFHHAVFDGWSEGVLVRELAALYEGRSLAPLAVNYGDYAAWQQTWLADGELSRQLDYWQARLGGVPALDLPVDRPRPLVQTYAGAVVTTTLDTAGLAPLATLARKEGVTLFMVLLAAWETLLARHSGQTDFAVGTPIAGRTRRELEELIGLFLNTLVLRADVAGDPLFTELLARVRTTTLDAYAHQDAPFEQIVETLNPPRDLSRPPLFQTLLVLQNSPVGEARVSGLALEPVHAETGTAKYELTLGARERDGGLELSLEFNTALFDRATAERMLARYRTLLAAVAAQPKRRLSALPLLPAAEMAMLRSWNETARSFPAGRWIHEFPALASPDAPAVVFGAGRLSYAEFGARVGELAAVLRTRGVGPETLVGVFLERSVELVVALHAVLHAGGAYVPLDPGYPAERVAHMLADSAAPIVITTSALATQLPPTAAQLLLLDALPVEAPPAASAVTLHGESAAYMIYTSGSTGKPKGAVNTHAGILNRLQWMQAALPLTADDRVLQKTPFSFDVSVWEFFWPLMTGATLVVAEPQVHKDPARLVELIVAEKITTLHFVPSMLRAFLDAPGVERCTTLRQVICSGEELPRELVDRFHARLPGALHNLYGPTETAVDVTWHACRRGETGPVPIGRPIANLEVHVLDAAWQPAPIGVPGEIYLGGAGLGRGYHARPELTAERWVPHPLSATPGARLYRTGDLGRWRADGEVEYLGRMDFQVKLRGFRIELGEIEAVLRAHEQVADAVVALRNDPPGDARLVGYVVARGGSPTIAELRAWLAARLPEHMIPAAWIFLAVLPLSPAGKTDRRALPAPTAVAAAPDAAPPEGPLEEFVAVLWTELLGVPAVGRDDNFFVLGGHSLLATQLISRLREQLQIELPLLRFFEEPTVAGCARALAGLEPAAGHAEKYARARLRLRALSPEEKTRLLASTSP